MHPCRLTLFVGLLDEPFAHEFVDDGIIGEGFDGLAFLAHEIETGGDRLRLHARDAVDVFGRVGVNFVDRFGFLEPAIEGDGFGHAIFLAGIAERRDAFDLGPQNLF